MLYNTRSLLVSRTTRRSVQPKGGRDGSPALKYAFEYSSRRRRKPKGPQLRYSEKTTLVTRNPNQTLRKITPRKTFLTSSRFSARRNPTAKRRLRFQGLRYVKAGNQDQGILLRYGRLVSLRNLLLPPTVASRLRPTTFFTSLSRSYTIVYTQYIINIYSGSKPTTIVDRTSVSYYLTISRRQSARGFLLGAR